MPYSRLARFALLLLLVAAAACRGPVAPPARPVPTTIAAATAAPTTPAQVATLPAMPTAAPSATRAAPTHPPEPSPTRTATAAPSPARTAVPSPTPSPRPAATRPAATATRAAADFPFAGLVYRAHDGLYRVGAAGPVRLVESPVAAITSDGRAAVFTDERGLWWADLSAGTRRNLLQGQPYSACCAQPWAARRDVVVFGAMPASSGPSMSSGHLAAVRTDGTGFRLLDPDRESIGLPALSPDGQTIAFDRGKESWLYRWDRGPERLDPARFGLTSLKGQELASPAWSPDGTKVAWVWAGDLNVGRRMGIAVFDLRAGTHRLLHLHEPIGRGGWPSAPAWSPDGEWLAWESWDQQRDHAGTWLLKPDGSEEYPLGGSSPVWSPDSQRVAVYVSTEIADGVRIVGVPRRDGPGDADPGLPRQTVPVAWLAPGATP